MTHDERCKLIKDSQDVYDAEIAKARTQRDRIAALQAALAASRVLTWYGIELALRNDKEIASLEEQIKLITEIAELAGVTFPAPRPPSLH
jgi:hypothetical protein